MNPRKLLEFMRLAVRNLLRHPLRTFLTTLGVLLGVSSVIALMAIGKGAEQAILREIGRLGINNIILKSVKPPLKNTSEEQEGWVQRYGLTFDDERQIKETVPGLSQILPVHSSPKTVWWGSRKVEGTVNAVLPRHMRLFKLDVVKGRNITKLDNDRLSRVCVIRAGLLRELAVIEDPIGRNLNVAGMPYEIVGVLADDEFLGYQKTAMGVDNQATQIYVPYRTVLKRVGTVSRRESMGSWEMNDVQLSKIIVSVENIDDVLLTARMLRRLLENSHEEQDFEMVVPLEVLEQKRRVQAVFNIALIVIAGISLAVGGIGIANIMLSTVTERTKEIGIRRALGAKQRHIVIQFLTETVTIALLGGLLGVVGGVGFSPVLGALMGYDPILTTNSIVVALTISMAVGIVSGILPAIRAAQLDPITALRHE